MAGEDLIGEYRERLERLRGELERPREELVADRSRVRDEILGLFKEVEGKLTELEAVKDAVRPLVERYRELFARVERPAGLARIDHLGSSTYRERGWSALAGGEYERALTELEKAIALDPENLLNRTMLAWAYLRLEEWEKAGPLLEGVLERDPEHALGRTCMGYLRLRQSELAEAIEHLSAVAREGRDRTAVLYANLYLGVVYAERDMHRDAQSFFRQALELGPNFTEAYWELGRSHVREGRTDLALDAWKTGAENRFNPWGERCRMEVERMDGSDAS